MHKVRRTFIVSASFLFVLLAARASAAQQYFKTLVDFDVINGASPYNASVVQGLDGTTQYGGGVGTEDCGGGCGIVFKIAPTGALATLYHFCVLSGCADGYRPYAGLIQATDGNLYGTTLHGGTAGCNEGTVFKINSTGTLTTLHSFCLSDGRNPSAALVQATDGNFYGTTPDGGANFYYGTVFKITPTGTLTTLLQLLRPKRLQGWSRTHSRLNSGKRRQFLRDNLCRWGQRLQPLLCAGLWHDF